MCAVEIKIFYKSRRIEISFDETFKPNDLIINFHMRMITSVIADTAKTIDLINILQFACNNTDQCDRYFFLEHIDWLFDATYDKLVNTTAPLLLKNTGTAWCVNGNEQNMTTSCCLGCAWIYSSITNQNEGICYEEYEVHQNLSIVTDLILSKEYQYKEENNPIDQNINKTVKISQTIHYWCASHWCNKGLIAQQINESVHNDYNLSAMFEILKVKIEMATEEVIKSSSSTSTTTTTKTTTKLISTKKQKTTTKKMVPSTIGLICNTDTTIKAKKSTSLITTTSVLNISNESKNISISLDVSTTLILYTHLVIIFYRCLF